MKIGFIGCGNMGGALAVSVSRVKDAVILLSDKDTVKRDNLADMLGATALSVTEVAELADYLFLGVKPGQIEFLAEELSGHIKDGAIIVSMAAGVSLFRLERLFDERKIIRIMPNTPVKYGKGVILTAANKAVSREELDSFLSLLAGAGKADIIPERLIDAGSAVSGCGPAFVYMFIEAMADGAVRAGLPRDKAIEYAADTLIGAATAVKESGAHTGELKDAVCSPGGSTIEGVQTLESGGFRGLVAEAVFAAYEKTKRLGD